MEKIKIASDSVCDLSPQIIAERDIGITPLHVILGDKEFSDGVDITPNDIFKYVKQSGELPKTSACAVEEFEAFFDAQLKEHDRVILFTISSKCSIAYENAVAAAKKYGDKVFVIDSEHLSTGQGLLVMKAADLRDGGWDAYKIVKEVSALRDKVQTSFVVDTTEYLYKGGRCTAAARAVTAILPIHPAIKMSGGQLGVMSKYMGTLKRCILKYVNDLAAKYPDYDGTRVFITHSCCSDEVVQAVKQAVEKKFKFNVILETKAGSVVTSHCGQGTLGVLFITA